MKRMIVPIPIPTVLILPGLIVLLASVIGVFAWSLLRGDMDRVRRISREAGKFVLAVACFAALGGLLLATR